jgi:hypothetical protein
MQEAVVATEAEARSLSAQRELELAEFATAEAQWAERMYGAVAEARAAAVETSARALAAAHMEHNADKSATRKTIHDLQKQLEVKKALAAQGQARVQEAAAQASAAVVLFERALHLKASYTSTIP